LKLVVDDAVPEVVLSAASVPLVDMTGAGAVVILSMITPPAVALDEVNLTSSILLKALVSVTLTVAPAVGNAAVVTEPTSEPFL